MLTKEKRIEQLLKQDDSHWRWRWGVAIATVVMTFLIAAQYRLYALLIVFISFFHISVSSGGRQNCFLPLTRMRVINVWCIQTLESSGSVSSRPSAY